MKPLKYLCGDCTWHGDQSEVLEARNPFCPEDSLLGCPRCRDVTIFKACDEDGCWKQVTCGVNTPSGYRQVCGDHFQALVSSPGEPNG
jgi:hypothetical protein